MSIGYSDAGKFQKYLSLCVLALTLINGFCFLVQGSGQVQGHSSLLQEVTEGPNLFTKINKLSKPPAAVINAVLAGLGAPECFASFSVRAEKPFCSHRILLVLFLHFSQGSRREDSFLASFPERSTFGGIFCRRKWRA